MTPPATSAPKRRHTRYMIRCRSSGRWLSPTAFEFLSLAVYHAELHGFPDYEIVAV